MFTKFYTFITLLSFVSAEGRLIHKNKTKTLEVIQTENPNPTIRLTRQSDDKSLSGISREDAVSDEFLKSYKRRHRIFLETNPRNLRKVRESNENAQIKHPKTEVPNRKTDKDYSKVLVKKPISKFSDIDYNDDFQTKMGKTRPLFGDSGDHEDEDFNLDDYDFDVNHDEFLSGRKPLEPRINRKPIESILAENPSLKIQAKIADKKEHRAIKREGTAAMYSRESGDYYDEITTSTEPIKESRESGIEYSDEEESTEGKKPQIRSIRSWDVGGYINKFGDQSSKVMNKFLSILPMFPQVPNDRNSNKSS